MLPDVLHGLPKNSVVHMVKEIFHKIAAFLSSVVFFINIDLQSGTLQETYDSMHFLKYQAMS